MNIGIFGGSFDPFHVGHRKIVEGALAYKKFDKLLIIPTARPSYKDRRLSPAIYRYLMCSLGFRDLPEVEIVTLELENTERNSYTAETLETLRVMAEENYSEPIHFSLIYGSDALDYFEKWYKPEKILKEAEVFIALRGDDALKQEKYILLAGELMAKLGGKISFFPMEQLELSSTELRNELQDGYIREKAFVPAVAEFLRVNKPYLFSELFEELRPETKLEARRIEMLLWKLMGKPRLLHSQNVALLAMYFASCHKLDIDQAYLAGLLHDACKEFPLDVQYEYAARSGYEGVLYDKTVHGPAASVWISEVLNIRDENILNAVKYHVTARPGMSDLEKLVYIADKTELAREYERLDEIRALARKDINASMRLCLYEVARAMKRKGLPLHDLTKALIEELGGFPD